MAEVKLRVIEYFMIRNLIAVQYQECLVNLIVRFIHLVVIGYRRSKR